MKPAFNDACDKTLLRCLEIANERGGEYSDSWSLDAPTIFLDLVLREIGAGLRPRAITATEKRLLRIANLCDTKLSRLDGPFKSDTLDDFLNYCAGLRSWLVEYIEAKPQGEQLFVRKIGAVPVKEQISATSRCCR